MASTLNLATLKTPGVYIDEVSLFPPSVAQVETAIPAFIGYTRIALKEGKDITGQPTRIKSMVEYRKYFGTAPDRTFAVHLDSQNMVDQVTIAPDQFLYDSLTMFFANGGEKCYIVSVGNYTVAPTAAHFTDALDRLKKYDEPTLIVMPDALRISNDGQLAAVQQAALTHCGDMQDRFAILDVKVKDITNPDVDDTDITRFRGAVGTFLKYGAAYYPYLKTALPVTVSFSSLTIRKGVAAAPISFDSLLDPGTAKTLAQATISLVTDVKKIKDSLLPDSTAYYAILTKGDKIKAIKDAIKAFAEAPDATFKNADALAAFKLYIDEATPTANGQKLIDLKGTANALVATGAGQSAMIDIDKTFEQVVTYVSGFLTDIDARLTAKEADMKSQIPLYSAIVSAAEAQNIILPPSGAVAGVYASVDETRGVWKAPANVSITNVVGPTVLITDDDQEGLNVDSDAGKSINAIRFFTNKGTLIWGARTLAGNDNEWRYVSVRRFFIMVEESVKKASIPFVFEPNDANTWIKVRAMIENFLTLQWRAGALAGIKAEHAFYVRVGLGQTMTAQDILNGFLIVETGLAAVRPAEFIVHRFAHKMQES
ncbi:hypothetical protein GCM10028808_27520 [Spirosoma migulaei]